MPNFREHTNMNMDLYFMFLMIAVGSGRLDLIPPSVGFLFGTFFMSPDCDLPGSITNQNWGHLGKWWDITYAWVFPHRGTKTYGISHWFVIGTLSRVVFLLPLVFAFTEIASYFNPQIFPMVRSWILGLDGLLFFCWWCLADGVHILLDKFQDITTNGRREYKDTIRIRGNGFDKDLTIVRQKGLFDVNSQHKKANK